VFSSVTPLRHINVHALHYSADVLVQNTTVHHRFTGPDYRFTTRLRRICCSTRGGARDAAASIYGRANRYPCAQKNKKKRIPMEATNVDDNNRVRVCKASHIHVYGPRYLYNCNFFFFLFSTDDGQRVNDSVYVHCRCLYPCTIYA